jgi:hypothetical protein
LPVLKQPKPFSNQRTARVLSNPRDAQFILFPFALRLPVGKTKHTVKELFLPRGRKSRPGWYAAIDVLSLGAAWRGGAENLVRIAPTGQYLF